MTHTNTFRGLVLCALLIPAAALAYTSPEEVLSSDQNARYFNPPPAARNTHSVQAAQQSSDAAGRDQAQQAVMPHSAAPTDSTVHDAAPSDQSALLQQLVDQLSQKNTVAPSDQRTLDRIHQQQYDAQVQAQAMVLVSQLGLQQSALHSGAPLSESGPGTIVSLIVLSAAGLWTFWHARKMEKTQ